MDMHSHSSLIWLAIALFVAWIVLRLVLAMTGGLLHLLWLGALIFLAIWLFQQMTGRGSPHT